MFVNFPAIAEFGASLPRWLKIPSTTLQSLLTKKEKVNWKIIGGVPSVFKGHCVSTNSFS